MPANDYIDGRWRELGVCVVVVDYFISRLYRNHHKEARRLGTPPRNAESKIRHDVCAGNIVDGVNQALAESLIELYYWQLQNSPTAAAALILTGLRYGSVLFSRLILRSMIRRYGRGFILTE